MWMVSWGASEPRVGRPSTVTPMGMPSKSVGTAVTAETRTSGSATGPGAPLGTSMRSAASTRESFGWGAGRLQAASATRARVENGRRMRMAVETGRTAAYFPNRFLSTRIMSVVMLARSYSGFQPHSARAAESSMWLGHESAMPWRTGSI